MLASIGLPEADALAYAPAFEAQGYDGESTLMFVTPTALTAMGIIDKEHRRLLLHAAADLRLHYELTIVIPRLLPL